MCQGSGTLYFLLGDHPSLGVKFRTEVYHPLSGKVYHQQGTANS